MNSEIRRRPALLLGLFFVMALPFLRTPSARAEELTDAQMREAVDAVSADLKESFGIALVFESQRYPIDGNGYAIEAGNPSLRDVYDYLPVLKEFLLYPKDFISVTKTKAIVLCSGLKYKDSQYTQDRAAVPDFSNQWMIYDVKDSARRKSYLLHVMHHEFFHMFDYRDDGQLYGDPEWSKLNEKDFEYGKGGAEAYENENGRPKKSTGFVSWYAMTGVEEDKAETFAVLMVRCHELEVVAKDDKVLAGKFDAMKALLVKKAKDMDAEYWTELETTRRGD